MRSTLGVYTLLGMDTTTPISPPRSAAEVVAAFGGPKRLSGLLGGISLQGVSNWSQRGSIPGDWHLRLLALAEREGVPLTAADLLALEEGEAA